MKQRYCIIEKNHKEYHAGAKARNDVATILVKQGWHPILTESYRKKDRAIDKIISAFAILRDWLLITSHIPPNSILLIQYPLAVYPKVRQLALFFLKYIKRKKVKLVYLIHDLDGLRGLNLNSERLFLSCADYMIVHNTKMKQYLEENGFQKQQFQELKFFDYLFRIDTLDKKTVHEDQFPHCQKTIVIAGNLSRGKAGYIYHLDEIEGKVQFVLYGVNYERQRKTKNTIYRGSVEPEALPAILHEDYGLIWDGDSIDECTGVFGKYLQYNSPHKASLYLAGDIPLIVWDKSALASIVMNERLGVVIPSLRDLPTILERISDSEYQEMKANIQRYTKRISAGKMLSSCLDNLDI